jgi:type I restriction enzyme M protein
MSPSTTKLKTLETTLWEAADKLRGNLEASEYKHVVLGLVFLKYVSDAFEARRAAIAASLDDPNSDDYIKDAERRNRILESKDEYASESVFWVAPSARWSTIQEKAKQPDIGVIIDSAMDSIESENASLRGVLPKTFGRADVDKRLLGELVDLIGGLGFTEVDHGADDVLGRVYEYFLGKFAATEGRGAGEFYTPRSIVKLLVDMLEPYHGRVYDPCCGSGGMFVQSAEFVAAHGGKRTDISVYGQEFVATTWRLAKMNMALRGIEANLGDEAADSFHNDKHQDLRADFIIANPPFNMSDWGVHALSDDVRWRYGTPPKNNANFAWIQHFVHHLAPTGTAGFVLANGGLSSNQTGEGQTRKALVDADLIDCVVYLPSQLFYSTQIAVSLWFVTKGKKPRPANGKGTTARGGRSGRTLFIDARRLGVMTDRTHRELTKDNLDQIAGTYRNWRAQDGSYKDAPGFAKEATIEEIKEHAYALVPGRYVGFESRPTAAASDNAKHLEDLGKIDEQIALVERLSRDALGTLMEVLRG